MNRPKILVVGAGAMGAVVGYHLHAAGADVSYLVRPARRATLGTSLRLWEHGAERLRELPRFTVVTEPGGDHDVVLVTLDGVALASPAGQELLVALGAALRDREAILAIGTVGLGVRVDVIARTGLPAERVVEAELGMLSYAVPAASFASARPAREAGADYGFRYMGDFGLVVAPDIPAARRLATLFDASGLSRGLVIGQEELSLGNVSIFPLIVVAALGGWPGDLTRDATAWALAVDSVRELRGLSIHGAAGAAAATSTTATTLLETWSTYVAMAAPLDWNEFSSYHHGSKVWTSDLLLLAQCVSEGEREGRPMPATRALLERASSSA